VQVRTGNPGHGHPPRQQVHVHKTTVKGDDWSGIIGGIVGVGVLVLTLAILWEMMPVLLVCALIGVVLAACM